LIHLYQTSSLLPVPLPIVASVDLKLLDLLIYSEHINHIQVLGFPLVCDPCPIILLPFVLDLKSTYDEEHATYGLLSLANFA
jgi:hypothetical protein